MGRINTDQEMKKIFAAMEKEDIIGQDEGGIWLTDSFKECMRRAKDNIIYTKDPGWIALISEACNEMRNNKDGRKLRQLMAQTSMFIKNPKYSEKDHDDYSAVVTAIFTVGDMNRLLEKWK